MTAHLRVFVIAAGFGLAAYAAVIGLIVLFRLIGLSS